MLFGCLWRYSFGTGGTAQSIDFIVYFKKMQRFICKQRWISDTESELGLGTIVDVALRRVTVKFTACNEVRVYAHDSAPLTRVCFQPGDMITDLDNRIFTIDSVRDNDGLLTYISRSDDNSVCMVSEYHLSPFLQLNTPWERLVSGQIDDNRWFELRCKTLNKLTELTRSPSRGLIGPRISLIPHQLYIANEVSDRYAPRVLLADEVGLGKTIEAGLILHRQLLTERAERVLLVTPATLVHQWLVEMLRRFNLSFSLFDEERCENACDAGTNPFHSAQLILCSLDFLMSNPRRADQAIAGEWDFLVVDEAHHLSWSETQASPEYTVIANIAAGAKGLLLLTATPEQLGQAGHFARLRLLDPDRFYESQVFQDEDAQYEQINALAQPLLWDKPLAPAALAKLLTLIGASKQAPWVKTLTNTTITAKKRLAARRQLLDLLLDRHGTGRVLFRNTRTKIKGFPERRLYHYPLQLPDIYRNSIFQCSDNLAFGLYPESALQPNRDVPTTGNQQCMDQSSVWWRIDPRVSWLMAALAKLKQEKVLIICAKAQTVLDLADAMSQLAGINAAKFHEDMTVVQRDRAAAWFTDSEQGARALVSSEIGSEGRNFQIAHHLVLFDLPLNPDLLEQRIGRLDRIGQQHTIQIHVPYLQDCAQEVLFCWFHQGLNVFEQSCPAASRVFDNMQQELLALLGDAAFARVGLEALVDKTKCLHKTMRLHMQRGRDQLLELNSNRPDIAAALLNAVQKEDQRHDLQPFLEEVADAFNIEFEPHRTNTYLLKPSNHMPDNSFPGLTEDGLSLTFNRNIALMQEDVAFFTWEHPFFRGTMDRIASGKFGNVAVITLKHTDFQPGLLLLETVFVTVCSAPKALQADRFLPPLAVRILIDQNQYEYCMELTIEEYNLTTMNSATAHEVVHARREMLRNLLDYSEALAAKRLPELVANSIQAMEAALIPEVDRLSALRQVNPSVRQEEISFLKNQVTTLQACLQSTKLRPDALRVIVAI